MKDVPIQEQINAARERCKHWLERSKELRANGLEEQAKFADRVSEMWLARQRRLTRSMNDKPTKLHDLSGYLYFSIGYFVIAFFLLLVGKAGAGFFMLGAGSAYLASYLDWLRREKRSKKNS